ncbi:acyl-CoA thioesterase [Priestia aryabhattai]|uniref:acyl-CoA thioesterase n=1 Tax=Priestia flexa TaxID=86664 RepID=UPI000BA089F4|nr:acyl-CoA thioesterase [Priestia flexa]OZT11704.1 acyl-CoA thioesterase [Priestia aryabhattai]
MKAKYCRESKAVRTSRVFPNDTNNHQTLFGGKLMSDIDMIASISASRHSRAECVTASTDSVHFLHPITPQDSVCFESYVSWTGRSSMEIFVKIIKENLKSGERKIAATSFITFVALGEDGKPCEVPNVIPETDEEKYLYQTAPERAKIRKSVRANSNSLAQFLSLDQPWS